MRKMIIGTFCVALLVAGTAVANNTLDVTGAAAQEGSYGMVVTHDGSTNSAYVQDNTPGDELTYNVEFIVNRNGGIYMSNCGGSCSTRHVIFLARDESGTEGVWGDDISVFRVIFGRLAADNINGPRYSVRLGCKKDGGPLDWYYIGGAVMDELAKRKYVRVEWQAASAESSNDGVCRLYTKNTAGGTYNLIAQREDLDNFWYEIDFVRMGAVSALGDQTSDADTSGDIYFDSFVSTR